MAAHVIQFARLEELLAEELPNVVRVTALDVTESTSSQIPGLRLAGIGVHVRTINTQGHILACTLPLASVEIYEVAPRDADPAWQTYDDAWSQAEALKERVMAYLTENGCAVTGAGIIHLDGVQPIPATWRSDPAQCIPGGENGDSRLSQPTLP
ncbi:MAG: hypothetical protein GX579_08875 [Chloroflexi bacterium]|nr:hypothetical protein [Chloroflexota bacterium]